MKTPDLKPREISLSKNYVNKILGMNFSAEEIKRHLERMRFGAEILNEDKLKVLIPAYRADILHQIDLVEDIAISYGYNKFQPLEPKLLTYGSANELENFSKYVREVMLGLGFQEVTTLILTNKRELFLKMNIPEQEVTETSNSVSAENSVARNWLLPSLMKILEHNKSREYPQKIFEVGECISSKGETLRKISAVIAHSKANFSEIKAISFGLLSSLGIEYEKLKIEKFSHGSFIEGRCASLKFGFFGELNPKVLEEFSIEMPATAFEFDLLEIFKEIKKKNLYKD
ncbi:MAG: hypothetical protein QXY62_05335 [Candidatus Altiarchaeota archaeon]